MSGGSLAARSRWIARAGGIVLYRSPRLDAHLESARVAGSRVVYIYLHVQVFCSPAARRPAAVHEVMSSSSAQVQFRDQERGGTRSGSLISSDFSRSAPA
eukprot:COSAG02_NODE_298_length_25350_cov_48.266999_4_plen_100_part_00